LNTWQIQHLFPGKFERKPDLLICNFTEFWIRFIRINTMNVLHGIAGISQNLEILQGFFFFYKTEYQSTVGIDLVGYRQKVMIIKPLCF